MDFAPVAHFTGHPVRGAGRGKDLGSPTINIAVSDVPAGLAQGIYAGSVKLADGKDYPAAMHYGPSPVFHAETSFEIHVIDHEVSDVPPSLEITVDVYLRAVRNFDSPAALKEQIQKDITITRAIMQSHD